MEKLSDLNKQNFTDQRKFIHRIAMLMGDIRENLTKHESDWSNMTLEVYENGIQTPDIANSPLNRLSYNIIDNDLYFYYGLKIHTMNLSGYSANEIHEMLSEQLQKYNIILKKHPDYNNEIINKQDRTRANFVNQINFFNEVLKKFHSSISSGQKSGIHVWPHDFDNSFVWKSGRKINGSDEQITIGVSNGDKYHELPYVYLTAFPANPAFKNIYTSRGHYHTEGWEGFALPYTEIQKENSAEEQEKVINDFLNSIFTKLSDEMKEKPVSA